MASRLTRICDPRDRSLSSDMREGSLSLPQKYLRLVSELAARGTIGVALLLGAASSGEASEAPADQQPTQTQAERVSERLAAIREAVSALAGAEAQTQIPDGERRLTWHNWGGGGGWG